MKNKKGMTLIEMIVSILIMSILVLGVSMLISKPMEAYARVATRQRLYQQGEYLLNKMTRDIQNAVPQSIRVTHSDQGFFLELVPVLAAARYRTAGLGALTFSAPQSSFNILQDYNTLRETLYASGSWLWSSPLMTPPADPLTEGLPFRIVIYNPGLSDADNLPVAGLNIYNPETYGGAEPYPSVGSHVITPAHVGVIFTDAGGGETTISLVDRDTGDPYLMQFAIPSPKSILYIVDSPVTYYCNTISGAHSISRHRDYPFSQNQPINPENDPDSVLAEDPFWDPGQNELKRTLLSGVNGCSFTYDAVPAYNKRLLTIWLTLTELNLGDNSLTAGGETVQVFKQIQVKNVL